MLDHQIRVVEEEAQLKERIEKLSAFIKSEKYAEVHPAEQTLLELQLGAMSTYKAILSSRINRFGNAA